MKLFRCENCAQVLLFENVRCERCGHTLGYVPQDATLVTLEPSGENWVSMKAPDRELKFCANAQFDACNWLLPLDSDETYCLACRHNRTVPELDIAENRERWRTLELAKHRLFYTMLRLGLPLKTRGEDPEHGLAFDFLAEPAAETGSRVLTGHDNGLITIALEEADDREREKRRSEMGERYRTVLGHFRHEVGHHFWDLLVRDGNHLDDFRALFGDDRQDYGTSLQAHYQNGAPADWQLNYISAYATSHPWEDFAETWAHYFHMVDTLEMARAFGVSVDPQVTSDASLSAEVDFDPHRIRDIQRLVDTWLPLCFTVNNLNRAMGQPDLYPFVLSPAVIEKLDFISRITHEQD